MHALRAPHADASTSMSRQFFSVLRGGVFGLHGRAFEAFLRCLAGIYDIHACKSGCSFWRNRIRVYCGISFSSEIKGLLTTLGKDDIAA